MDRHMQGLTLIELLVAVAILGVTLGLVAPAFRQMTLAVRANGVFHELTASLAMARTHSLMRTPRSWSARARMASPAGTTASGTMDGSHSPHATAGLCVLRPADAGW